MTLFLFHILIYQPNWSDVIHYQKKKKKKILLERGECMARQGRIFRGVFILAGARLGEEASTKTQPWLTIHSLLSSNIVLNRLEGAKM